MQRAEGRERSIAAVQIRSVGHRSVGAAFSFDLNDSINTDSDGIRLIERRQSPQSSHSTLFMHRWCANQLVVWSTVHPQANTWFLSPSVSLSLSLPLSLSLSISLWPFLSRSVSASISFFLSLFVNHWLSFSFLNLSAYLSVSFGHLAVQVSLAHAHTIKRHRSHGKFKQQQQQ